MIRTEDILERIKIDFGDESEKATKVLNSFTHQSDSLNQDRIVRCIIFLSKGSLEVLIHRIQQASEDPRDVMLWAEYEGLQDGEELKRVRDFNKTFAEQ